MESAASNRLKLGDLLNGTVVKSIGGRRFAITCKKAPNGWKVELHSRSPETVRPGAAGTFWVAKIAPLQRSILVHDGDFGRLPISETMRSRYRSALNALLGDSELSGDDLSDARSMVLRIEKMDQADWLSVWRILGEPATGDVKQLLAAIEAIRTARKEEPSSVAPLHIRLKEKYGELLQTANARLG